MGRHAVAVPMLALVFGLAAAGLSFLAYAKRIKIQDVSTSTEGLCVYPSSAAFFLGLFAALFILLHQILISVGTGCFCCGRNKFPGNICGIIALILFILSWLSFIITFTGLISTVVINDKRFLRIIKYTSNDRNNSGCLLGRDNVFLGAACWCLINLLFSMSAYATYMCGVRRHRHHAKARPNLGA